MRPRTEAQRTGAAAEDLAERYLQRHGLVPVERNFRARGGEIDLVMREGTTLVFVEVRYRGARTYGGALASVDARKQRRLIHAARLYLARLREPEPTCRFDVLGVAPGSRPDTARVQWVRDAFSAGA